MMTTGTSAGAGRHAGDDEGRSRDRDRHRVPEPGEIQCADYRDQKTTNSDSTSARVHARARATPESLRVVQWNIERGYQLPKIIHELKQLDADIIALQEVDVACARSNHLDTGHLIASALGMNYVYVCEFHELLCERRSARDQGGPHGHHGNAILTRFDVSHTYALVHRHQPVDWAREGETRGERRRGQRVTLVATLETPHGPVVMYNAHFEVYCGLGSRLRVLGEIFEHSRKMQARYPQQLILGDCNTMAHGIARLSRRFCNDSFRWRSVGWTEAEFWVKHVLDFHDDDGPLNTLLVPFAAELADSASGSAADEAGNTNEDTHRRAVTTLRRCRNPGFFDPFDAYHDYTLVSHRGWYQGKLDWLLCRALAVHAHWMGNADFQASDHKYLAADVTFDSPSAASKARLRRTVYRRGGMFDHSAVPRVLALSRIDSLRWVLTQVFIVAMLLYVFSSFRVAV